MPGHVEEPESESDEPMPSLHAHVFGGSPSPSSFESLSPSPSRQPVSHAGQPVTDQNDSIQNDEIREMPLNVDDTMIEALRVRANLQRRRGRESTRSTTPSARNRTRSRERDAPPAGIHYSRRNAPELGILCPICERDDESSEDLNDFIIQEVIGKKSMKAICRIAWKRLYDNDRLGNCRHATPSMAEVSYHARTCLSHPNIIVRMEMDKWKSVGEALHAASAIGTTSNGAPIFDPDFIKNAKSASDELRKWINLVPKESKSLRVTSGQTKSRRRVARNPLY